MKKFISILLALVLFVSFIGKARAISGPTEILYLSDSMNSGDGQTRIYTVALDSGTTRANLTEITGSPIPFDQVDALAASPDGSLLYAIDKNSTKLGILTVATGAWVEVGTTGIPEVVLAATNLDGKLFAVSQSNNKIYEVDKATAVATDKGFIKKDGTTTIDISGADIVFSTDGKMYLWTNAGGAAPKGLYVVSDPSSFPLSATYLGQGTGNFFTGLAIRENGKGDLVGSDTSIDKIVVISKTDGSMPTSYSMYKGDNPYSYTFGDMTAGPIISPLEISKTVNLKYDRSCDWTIAKKGDVSSLTLAEGEEYTANYEVKLDKECTNDGWEVWGKIDINNPNIMNATVTGVTDQISDAASPDMEITECHYIDAEQQEVKIEFPFVLEAGKSFSCSYAGLLPSGDARKNTATVATGEGLIKGNYVEENIDFTEVKPTKDEDECVSVGDDKYGSLATEQCEDKTFTYSLTVGPYERCGKLEYKNTASFETNDTKATGSSDWTVAIDVPCPGCTLTQGYWKTHSEYGKAPYDDNWAKLASGADTPFFLSGQTWYKVFWTPPKGGNAYYQLAHQYMAATLNKLNGASAPTSVNTALTQAAALFNANTPAQAALLKGTAKNAWTNLAGTLGNYNEGLIGPGHCDEQTMPL